MINEKGKMENFAIQYFNSVEIFFLRVLILGILSVLVLVEWIK